MKATNLLTCAIPMVFAVSMAFAQDKEKETFSIIGGPTVQFFEATETEVGIGYYLGIKPETPLTSWLSVGSQIFFMQQFVKSNDISFKNSSANASFYVALKPVEQFKLIGGFVGGINATMTADNEKLKGPNDRISWLAGASISMNEKVSVDLTYVHPKNEQLFTRTIMIGVAFKVL